MDLEEDFEGRTETKKVTVNEEPEIFIIIPNTVTVVRAERPKPPPKPPTSETDEIIKKTVEMVRFCEEKIMSQRVDISKLGFMLLRIGNSLGIYDDFTDNLNRFLIHGDQVTADYNGYFCDHLPSYGDMVKSLDDTVNTTVTVDGVDKLVDKVDLKRIVTEIRDNAHAGGMFLRTVRVMNKVVHQYMQDRRDIIERITKQMQPWITLENAVNGHLEELMGNLFKISAHLDFLQTGDTTLFANMDLSSSSGDSNSPLKDSISPFRDNNSYFGGSFRYH